MANTGNVVATIDGDTITYDDVLAMSAVTGDTINNEAFARTLYSLVIDHAIVASADAEMGIGVSLRRRSTSLLKIFSDR